VNGCWNCGVTGSGDGSWAGCCGDERGALGEPGLVGEVAGETFQVAAVAGVGTTTGDVGSWANGLVAACDEVLARPLW
jgi:hypothetical protein